MTVSLNCTKPNLAAVPVADAATGQSPLLASTDNPPSSPSGPCLQPQAPVSRALQTVLHGKRPTWHHSSQSSTGGAVRNYIWLNCIRTPKTAFSGQQQQRRAVGQPVRCPEPDRAAESLLPTAAAAAAVAVAVDQHVLWVYCHRHRYCCRHSCHCCCRHRCRHCCCCCCCCCCCSPGCGCCDFHHSCCHAHSCCCCYCYC